MKILKQSLNELLPYLLSSTQDVSKVANTQKIAKLKKKKKPSNITQKQKQNAKGDLKVKNKRLNVKLVDKPLNLVFIDGVSKVKEAKSQNICHINAKYQVSAQQGDKATY